MKKHYSAGLAMITGCGSSTSAPSANAQLQRAHDLGVTCSIFVDQIHYWGDVIVDGLFGPEHGERWMPCGSAVKTGMRISLHNDPPVTQRSRCATSASLRRGWHPAAGAGP